MADPARQRLSGGQAPAVGRSEADFRVAFTNSEIDFRHLKAGDLDRLTDSIVTEANRRLGASIVRQVLFQQLNFVKKEDIRTNWIGGASGAD